MSTHIPVLLKETISGLNIKPDGTYLDLTVGRGGHSSEILKRLTTGHLYGFDQDEEAIKESQINLFKISDKFTLIRSNFRNIKKVCEELGIIKVDGILMDLGVSSPQFDEASRGFSYRENALLDMRMDQSSELTAREIVNTYSLDDLTRIFRDYGEERFAYQIAKNIVKQRENEPIDSTLQLVEIIKKSKPAKELKKVGHPAKQVFQALRIAVNDELNALIEAVNSGVELLNHKGRLAIITFHSLEDRIVKQKFKDLSVVVGNRNDFADDILEKDFVLVNNKPITASEDELLRNHRSASAKLRILERK